VDMSIPLSLEGVPESGDPLSLQRQRDLGHCQASSLPLTYIDSKAAVCPLACNSPYFTTSRKEIPLPTQFPTRLRVLSTQLL